MPQLIEECFDQILATAAAIDDPFEQALLRDGAASLPAALRRREQARVAPRRQHPADQGQPLRRCPSPTCRARPIPTPCSACTSCNKVDLLRDVFIWAYERSAARYAAVRQSLGEPDPFRLRHRAALREVVAEVVRARMDKKQAAAHVARVDAMRISSQPIASASGDRRDRAPPPARGEFRALPDQAVGVRGVAGSVGRPVIDALKRARH